MISCLVFRTASTESQPTVRIEASDARLSPSPMSLVLYSIAF